MINVENTLNILEESKILAESKPENAAPNNTITVPFLGRLHCVRDKEGQMYLSGVLAYWFFGTFPMIYISLWPAYEDGHIPLAVVYGE